MSRVDKTLIRDHMLTLERAALDAARADFEAGLEDSQLDDREGFTNDDMANARAKADVAHGIEALANAHEAKISALESIDFSEKSEAGVGAVVSFSGRNYVIAVATEGFEIDGQSFMGLSQDSPISRRIEGLMAGDSFDQAGVRFTLDDVY